MTHLSIRAKLLSIIPHFTAGLSLLIFGFIVFRIVRNREQRTFHRVLLVMSTCDLISSFAYFTSTWASPQGTKQGIGIQFGVVTAFYNCSLCLQYLLVVRYKATPVQLRKKYDKCLLLIPFITAIVLTLPGIVFKMHANSNLWCWIAVNYENCVGDHAESIWKGNIYDCASYCISLWLAIFCVMFAQLLLFWTVRQTEKRAHLHRWSHPW
mmetsp:Transcript_19370/g.28461  ORF Transcript_19370/g.28461 Transcript_19370/m.28461 type:complete len:210 (-) Transcript_19370:471-1100(-)